MRGGADVSAKAGLGIKVREIALNYLALNRVGVVRAPNLRAIAQHTKVEAVAAGGAAFQKNVGSEIENSAQHIVETQNIIVCLRAQSDAVAVHVPFHIADGRAVQYTAHAVNNIIANLCLCQVKEQLVAAEKGAETVRQSPIGVGAVQIGVHVHSLRLKPKTEVQTHRIYLLCQTFQAVGQLLGVHIVVAKARLVIIALAEPTVIQHEELAAKSLGILCQSNKPVVVKVEHAALPAVKQHGALSVLPIFRHDAAVYKAVHLFGQTGKALVRKCHHSLGAFKAFTGQQSFCKVGGGNALNNSGKSLQGTLCGRVVVAGVDKVEAVNSAKILRCTLFAEQETGIVAVRGEAGHALVHNSAVQNGNGVLSHLGYPATIKTAEIVAAVNVHKAAHQLGEGDRLCAGVFQHTASAENSVEKAEVQIKLHAFLHKLQLQSLLCALCLRQAAFCGGYAIKNLKALIAKIRGNSGKLNGAFSVVASAGIAPCKGQRVRAAAAVCVV